MEKPDLVRMTVEFDQEGNTLGTTEQSEVLFLNFEYQLPGDAPFLVIRSETGWSFDDPDELLSLVNRALEAEKLIREG